MLFPQCQFASELMCFSVFQKHGVAGLLFRTDFSLSQCACKL